MATLAAREGEARSATPGDQDPGREEDEFAATSDGGESEGFEPEPPKGRKKRTSAAASKSQKKKPAAPKKKPTIDRKTFIKTENKDGTKITRDPQVNSDYVPIPWKGRIGYACLNTYLRSANPPIFCSRTCRIETILKQGSVEAGKTYVESLGLANAWDLVKMIHWNERYGIKFLRISSEMFPFASHLAYGYSLDFAAEPLREAGKAAMLYGHRLTTHPGQYTQIASPKDNVVEASVRDLEYHAQLLGLLGLEGQSDRDAVMILHMGGVFGDKQTTLDRFRKNYTTLLSDNIKARLVLENDDVNYTVHDLLPICQELSIPLVLDWHHHNIRHDPTLREGSLDILPTLPAIAETWSRKNITQKQHYSEPRDDAVTDRDMRKHSKRVRRLPPCDDTMDLMIEAKDKEQAVFELYKTYGIGPEGLFAEVRPHERDDENPPEKPRKEAAAGGAKVEDAEVAMGGKERRVYWPEGCEHWLSPAKKVRAKKEPDTEEQVDALPAPKKRAARKTKVEKAEGEEPEETKPVARKNKKTDVEAEAEKPPPSRQKRQKTAAAKTQEPEAATTATTTGTKKKRSAVKKVPVPTPSDSSPGSPPLVSDDENEEVASVPQQEVFLEVDKEVAAQRRSGRVRKPVVR